MSTVIKVENISKQYRLGEVGTGAIKDDFKRWRYRMMGKEDPFLMVGAENDRTKTGKDDYVWALKDINFEVKQGEVLGIIGRNGAGKSTLLKILSRTTTPTTGQIKIKGRIASLLEVGTGFHPELSGRDNIFLNGAILGMTKTEIKSKFDEIVDFAGVEKYIDTPVKRYSSGMYVRLAFGVAAHLEPEILIVDEVLAVGDAEFQKKALGKMKDVSVKDGRTVLFVSHNMAAVKSLCGYGLLMEKGTVRSIGKVDEIISNYLTVTENEIDSDLENLQDRSGSKAVIFSNFHFENDNGEKIDRIFTGDNLNVVFRIKVNKQAVKKIDIGFAFQDRYRDPIANLYSSFQGVFFDLNEGYHTIKCAIPRFAFATGVLFVSGRILTNGEESDWPKAMLGTIEVEPGDFFGTGQVGSVDWNSKYLFKGEWKTF